MTVTEIKLNLICIILDVASCSTSHSISQIKIQAYVCTFLGPGANPVNIVKSQMCHK